MMIDLCSPRGRLVYYSSYKSAGCWTFCETPLGDPGNVHWCQGVWSSRARVSSFLLWSTLLTECDAKCSILYAQTWAIQKVVQHIISLGEAFWTSSAGNRSWDELEFILQKNPGTDPSAEIRTLEAAAVEIANFQMPLLHCFGDNVAFPVPASAGAVWARSDFGKWIICCCSHNTLPRQVSVVLNTVGDSSGAAVSLLLPSTSLHQGHLN